MADIYKIGGKLTHKELFHAGNFKQNSNILKKAIEGCHFIHQIEITLPHATHVPEDVAAVLDDNEFYLITEAPLKLFLDPDFIGAFVKTGKIHFLSYRTRIDVDDCVALLPTGKLVLSITKDIYEELGIEGKKCTFESKKSRKFVVEIDLLAKSFYPGRPCYDRILKKFEERVELTFDFLCTWVPHDNSISSRSLFAYLKSKNYKIQQYTNTFGNKCTYNVPTPIISWETTSDSEYVEDKEFFEWLGAVTCEIDLTTSHDAYVSTFTCPQPSKIVEQISRTRWTGFLTPDSVNRILEKLRETAFPKFISWLALTVIGFDDTPVVDNQDHGVALTNGDNFYSIIRFTSDNYWLHKCKTEGTK